MGRRPTRAWQGIAGERAPLSGAKDSRRRWRPGGPAFLAISGLLACNIIGGSAMLASPSEARFCRFRPPPASYWPWRFSRFPKGCPPQSRPSRNILYICSGPPVPRETAGRTEGPLETTQRQVHFRPVMRIPRPMVSLIARTCKLPNPRRAPSS
jgi:hypothetical protein